MTIDGSMTCMIPMQTIHITSTMPMMTTTIIRVARRVKVRRAKAKRTRARIRRKRKRRRKSKNRRGRGRSRKKRTLRRNRSGRRTLGEKQPTRGESEPKKRERQMLSGSEKRRGGVFSLVKNNQ